MTTSIESIRNCLNSLNQMEFKNAEEVAAVLQSIEDCRGKITKLKSCTVCGMLMSPGGIRGHMKNIHAVTPNKSLFDPNSVKLCSDCDLEISRKNWAVHLKTQKHQVQAKLEKERRESKKVPEEEFVNSLLDYVLKTGISWNALLKWIPFLQANLFRKIPSVETLKKAFNKRLENQSDKDIEKLLLIRKRRYHPEKNSKKKVNKLNESEDASNDQDIVSPKKPRLE